jgi:hypothetical protein
VARVCQDFLNQNHIRILPWPALSPDLSPIEHLWDEHGRLEPINRWKKASAMLLHSCTSASRSSGSVSGGEKVYRVHPINVQLVKRFIELLHIEAYIKF